MSGTNTWSLSQFDLTAKLQACEIELQYTREELERHKQELDDHKQKILKRDKQISLQVRRQHEIENIHKELMYEYEQQITGLKNDVKEIKQNNEKLLAKYKLLEQKNVKSEKKATLPSKVVQTMENVEKFLRKCDNNSSIASDHSNTLETLRTMMSGHCVYLCDEMLKRPLTKSKLRHLEENVSQFLWIVSETQQRLQEMNKELRLLTDASSDFTKPEIVLRNCSGDEESHKENTWSNMDWEKIMNSKLTIDNVWSDESEQVRDLEDRIKSYLSVLEKLMAQASKKRAVVDP